MTSQMRSVEIAHDDGARTEGDLTTPDGAIGVVVFAHGYHMVDTLDRLVAHHGPGAKAIVWAHNTHVGDGRATDMAAAGWSTWAS